MVQYTVEVTTAPVSDWDALRAVLDAVPGSILLEDPEFPELILPVEADSPTKAVTFVDGLAQVIGFTPVSGKVYETPAADFEPLPAVLSEPAMTTMGVALTDWVSALPPAPRARGRHRIPA